MTENTVNGALRRLGWSGSEMTGQGFRSMASTLLNEQGWSRDAIERQLAHAERDSICAAYNYAKHLPERRRMMQAWSDYLFVLKADVPEINPMQDSQRSKSLRVTRELKGNVADRAATARHYSPPEYM